MVLTTYKSWDDPPRFPDYLITSFFVSFCGDISSLTPLQPLDARIVGEHGQPRVLVEHPVRR